ncbi:MAG: hypothetical protein ACOC92_01475 [bacterium]
MNVNLYLTEELLREVERRHDGDRRRWNRSAVVRTMLTAYLELARTPPALPPGALPVLRTLLRRPEDYPQLFRFLPRVLAAQPRLEETCRRHGTTSRELLDAVEALAPHEVLALLDQLLQEAP